MVLFLFGCSTPSTVNDINFSLNPGIDTVLQMDEYTDPGATATYQTRKYRVEVVENNVDTRRIGDYTIIYQISYNDVTRNITRVVSVIPNVNYSISLNPGVDTVQLGQDWTDAGVQLSNFDDFTITVEGEVNTDKLGTYTIHYRAEHSSGAILTISRIVTIIE